MLYDAYNGANSTPTIGKDFIFAYPNVYLDDINPGVLLLVVVSNNNNILANINVTSTNPSFSTFKASVAPFNVIKIPITPVSIEAQYPGYNMTNNATIVVENKGIRVQADVAVAVYAHAEVISGYSADTFLVTPTMLLGTEYLAITSTFPLLPNMIMVVANQDNTQIIIGNQTATLNALQVASIALRATLSGTRIRGNKPFAAVSGGTCSVTLISSDGCSYEAVMLEPVGTWGTQFVAIPFMYLDTNTNYYQIVTHFNNTVVSAGGTVVAHLNSGIYGEFRQILLGSAVITSNNPIQVIQLGQNTNASHSNLGNPFFMKLPSTDKMSNTGVLFQPTGYLEYDGVHLLFFVRVITNLAGAGTIQMDGNTISALQFKRVPNSGFYFYEQITQNKTHSVTTTNPATQFFV
uniref:IgGFc-binding protein N-terminal domain-containing protein n=1 Tax=Plectus sambesii TaxID=2011161 RepID=A0A914WPR3_9BILA